MQNTIFFGNNMETYFSVTVPKDELKSSGANQTLPLLLSLNNQRQKCVSVISQLHPENLTLFK